MALVATLIKARARSCVLNIADDGMGGNLPYADIAALLPASCRLKALFSATYSTGVEAIEAFAAKGMQFSKLATNNSMTPAIGPSALISVGAGGLGANVAALRIAIDHSLTD